jgi:hypothetical protein
MPGRHGLGPDLERSRHYFLAVEHAVQHYLFFSDRPLLGVTLVHGERRLALPFKMLYAGGEQTPASLPYCDCQVLLDRTYYAPLWDKNWPDDTLLEFDYMDEVAP